MSVNKIKAEDVIDAVNLFKDTPVPEFTYYFHGGKEQRETGLSVKEVVEHFKNDLSVIVVDLIKGKYYRAGNLLEVADTTKNAKSIEFENII